jgi:L,D-transpeptidase ErfK/SrfK
MMSQLTVKTRVPPGPDNPLGQYWIGLSLVGYGIHGTIASASIYQFRSHGCIRIHPNDIADLFGRVSLGTSGHIIYTPVLLARLTSDQIY